MTKQHYLYKRQAVDLKLKSYIVRQFHVYKRLIIKKTLYTNKNTSSISKTYKQGFIKKPTISSLNSKFGIRSATTEFATELRGSEIRNLDHMWQVFKEGATSFIDTHIPPKMSSSKPIRPLVDTHIRRLSRSCIWKTSAHRRAKYTINSNSIW